MEAVPQQLAGQEHPTRDKVGTEESPAGRDEHQSEAAAGQLAGHPTSDEVVTEESGADKHQSEAAAGQLAGHPTSDEVATEESGTDEHQSEAAAGQLAGHPTSDEVATEGLESPAGDHQLGQGRQPVSSEPEPAKRQVT